MGNVRNVPVIIKRKKVIAGDGHHGGAWKVAYADFVTAMMAFFLLMWLLNATTEQQRKGIADYFTPSIPVNRISGGGDGMFGGANVMAEDSLADALNNSARTVPIEVNFDHAAETAALMDIEDALLGIGGESLIQQEALRHVVTRLTDEGLVIEVFARPDVPLFIGDTSQPEQVLVDLITMFARAFEVVTNPIAVDGHTRGRPVVFAHHPVWDISTDRAEAVRRLLENGGVAGDRIARITGNGDHDLAERNALSVRNDRIEITLLREVK